MPSDLLVANRSSCGLHEEQLILTSSISGIFRFVLGFRRIKASTVTRAREIMEKAMPRLFTAGNGSPKLSRQRDDHAVGAVNRSYCGEEGATGALGNAVYLPVGGRR